MNQATIDTPPDVSGDPRQVLMFGVGEEVLAISAELVREIIDPVPATRVAGARAHLPAMINVRGAVVPLADLRLRFGLQACEATSDSRIVVVDLVIDGDPVVVGLMADKVYEVTTLSPTDLQPTPRVGLRWPAEFVRSFACWNDRFIIVPDLERILA